jgi:hypothetical protein
MSTRLHRRQLHKSASYTVNPVSDSPGTTFTNRGASGAVTFTLPKPTRALLGHWYRFLGLVAQNIVVAAPTADTLVALNDVAADSVALATAGQIIGAVIEVECMETASGTFQWHAHVVSNGATATVATA